MQDSEKKIVLVIDDDPTIRKLIAYHLKHNNYSVLEAQNATEAFNLLKDNKVDLVLSDVSMDEMDGFAFCKKVRESDKHRFLPFVFVTAKNTLEDKSKAIESGGDDIITKPFDINELILKVQALIRRTEIYRTYGLRKSIENKFKDEKTKILLVDDDISITKLFKYNLETAGYECQTASNVDEALEATKSYLPDVIISDIMMPKTDGFQFRKLLLEDPELRSVPFIFLTAKGTEDDILEGFDLGITDYVLKTAGPKVVVAKVSAIIKSLGNERRKVVSEIHQAASSLGAKVVTDILPDFNGFSINHWHLPYKGIPGGDFLDYYKLDDTNLLVILGDVMGKKWGAWYFAFAYAGYIRSSLRGILQSAKEYSPGEIMQKVNEAVYKDAKISEVFTTLSIVLLNSKTKELKYAGAGDSPLLYRDSADNQIKKLKSQGLLLGFSHDGGYEDVTLKTKSGDQFFLFTDGLIESRDKSNHQFGEENFHKLLSGIKVNEDSLEIIKTTLSNYTQGDFEDDISLIAIKAL